jgi:AraC family transcriptional regulator
MFMAIRGPPMSKPQTRASYEARLNRVVDHIYAHLDEDIRFDDLAEVACLSPYHWHRIYAAIRGETIAATVRRLRLLRAADRLANSSEPLKAIAERAGYGALDAFARAFKEHYGKTPADYRSNGSHAMFKAATRKQDITGDAVRRSRAYRIVHADRLGDGSVVLRACRQRVADAGSTDACGVS